jgi:hypothetical protein
MEEPELLELLGTRLRAGLDRRHGTHDTGRAR